MAKETLQGKLQRVSEECSDLDGRVEALEQGGGSEECNSVIVTLNVNMETMKAQAGTFNAIKAVATARKALLIDMVGQAGLCYAFINDVSADTIHLYLYVDTTMHITITNDESIAFPS